MFRRDDGSLPERTDDPLRTMGDCGPAWDDVGDECIDEDVQARAAALEAAIEVERVKWARVYELAGSSTVAPEEAA